MERILHNLRKEYISLPQVKKVIAVAAGKGGVGKSIFSVNLCALLAGQGKKVGLVDLDIYGPSVPFLLGESGTPVVKEGKFIPKEVLGIKSISIGYLTSLSPIIWRGPLVQTAVKQLFKDVSWGELDILVVDMPPGTGDVHLTLAQSIPMEGAIVISTPFQIAWLDARKAVHAFKDLGVPVLGLVENMGDGRFVKDKSLEEGVPYLGSIPFSLELARCAEEANPITLQATCRESQAYERIWQNLNL